MAAKSPFPDAERFLVGVQRIFKEILRLIRPVRDRPSASMTEAGVRWTDEHDRQSGLLIHGKTAGYGISGGRSAVWMRTEAVASNFLAAKTSRNERLVDGMGIRGSRTCCSGLIARSVAPALGSAGGESGIGPAGLVEKIWTFPVGNGAGGGEARGGRRALAGRAGHVRG